MIRTRPQLVSTLLALLSALLGLVLSAEAGAGKAPLIDPDTPGPFAVGRTTFDILDATRGRVLTLDAWYPVDAADAVGPASVYDLLVTGIESQVALADPEISLQGPFPLVVFSHGNGGIRFQSFFLAEALASHGFFVVSADHRGNTALDALFGTQVPFEQAAIDRPLDVSAVITHMLELSAEPGGGFEGRIDATRIGVAGHSFGGFTALAVAAGFAGSLPDPRVDAIVPISPVSSAFSDEALAAIGIPALILGGTSDVTTPVDPQSRRAFELISGTPRYRIDVLDAGHASFTDICAIEEALLGSGLPPVLVAIVASNAVEGCAPELIPIEEAHRLSDYYVVAFLQRFVAGDKRYGRFLKRGRVARDDLAVDFFEVKRQKTKKVKKPKKAKKLKKLKKAKKVKALK